MILRVENLVKYFGGLAAVNGLSFSMEEDEILGMIGPNGSGKTTVFNLISGVLKPTSGDVYYKERKITGLRPHKIAKMGIARTFQIPQPFARMSVLENVMVGSMFGGNEPTHEARRRAEELIEMVGLGDKMYTSSEGLTSQDRKRLELARALASEPKLLLLDEIMAGLTPTEIENLIKLLFEIHKSGVTLLVVEHVMRAVMKLSRRIIVLHQGKLLMEGTPKEVANNEEVIKVYLGERHA
jgi:branched-chain amino acid transport system ATP-binding protein